MVRYGCRGRGCGWCSGPLPAWLCAYCSARDPCCALLLLLLHVHQEYERLLADSIFLNSGKHPSVGSVRAKFGEERYHDHKCVHSYTACALSAACTLPAACALPTACVLSHTCALPHCLTCI